MPQENLNKIWKAGKLFEEPKLEQPTKEPIPDVTQPQNVKRKINVAKAFIPTQEDPFKKKVEAVLKGIEPASSPATAGEEEKSVPDDAEVIVGTGQDNIGERLATGKSIYVKGDAGVHVGHSMSGGEIYVEGGVGHSTGYYMSGGEIRVERDAGRATGNNMSGGEIHVKGEAGDNTGHSMFSGTLRIDGNVASFHESAFTPDNKGTIIWKGETIWKKGKKVEPGWTNLNVRVKIEK